MSANPFGFRFDNSYARLPETLFAFCDPQLVRAPELNYCCSTASWRRNWGSTPKH